MVKVSLNNYSSVREYLSLFLYSELTSYERDSTEICYRYSSELPRTEYLEGALELLFVRSTRAKSYIRYCAD